MHAAPHSTIRIARLAASAALASLLAAPLLAAPQWSKDASQNLVVSDGDGEEVQTKLAAAPDGGYYASWYDSDPDGAPAFGYDVRLQRFDPTGRPLWAAGGVLVADRGFSSTQDYGLSVGPDGDAYLAFRDDRSGSVQITATRVDGTGTEVWGVGGVQVTNTSQFLAAPKVAATDDGACVVAWTQDATTILQRLDASGAPLWGAGVSVPVAAGTTASVSGLVASDAGAAVFSWVEQSGGFFGPRHLRAQRLTAAGAPAWGAGVTLFDAGSLQIGNFPPLASDGAGGAVCAWYGVSPLQCYAQHVLSDGTLAFGPNGVEVSTNATRIRVSPSAAFDPDTDSTYVFWVEESTNQALNGVWGQRLDGAGVRQWTDDGASLVPLGTSDVTNVRTALSASGAAALWFEAPLFGAAVARGVHVNAGGAPTHPITDFSTTPSSKSDLAVIGSPFDEVRAAWDDDESGDADVLAQNLRGDGGLGAAAGALVRTAGTNPLSYTASVGPLGGQLDLSVDLTTTGHAFAVVLGYLGALELPLGAEFLLVNVADPAGELLMLPVGVAPLAGWSLPLPNNPALCGVVLATQAFHVDLALPVAFANANDLYLGL